jgi:hypothetical protein
MKYRVKNCEFQRHSKLYKPGDIVEVPQTEARNLTTFLEPLSTEEQNLPSNPSMEEEEEENWPEFESEPEPRGRKSGKGKRK